MTKKKKELHLHRQSGCYSPPKRFFKKCFRCFASFFLVLIRLNHNNTATIILPTLLALQFNLFICGYVVRIAANRSTVGTITLVFNKFFGLSVDIVIIIIRRRTSGSSTSKNCTPPAYSITIIIVVELWLHHRRSCFIKIFAFFFFSFSFSFSFTICALLVSFCFCFQRFVACT